MPQPAAVCRSLNSRRPPQAPAVAALSRTLPLFAAGAEVAESADARDSKSREGCDGIKTCANGSPRGSPRRAAGPSRPSRPTGQRQGAAKCGNPRLLRQVRLYGPFGPPIAFRAAGGLVRIATAATRLRGAGRSERQRCFFGPEPAGEEPAGRFGKTVQIDESPPVEHPKKILQYPPGLVGNTQALPLAALHWIALIDGTAPEEGPRRSGSLFQAPHQGAEIVEFAAKLPALDEHPVRLFPDGRQGGRIFALVTDEPDGRQVVAIPAMLTASHLGHGDGQFFDRS